VAVLAAVVAEALAEAALPEDGRNKRNK